MLILASSSPRRRELLLNAGFQFEVEPANVPEEQGAEESPSEFALRLAREKAEAVARRRPGDVVIGADTIVVVDSHTLGKPKDEEDARRMLRMLSGREHDVTTAVCVMRGEESVVEAVTTRVFVSELSAAEIDEYVAMGEPMDKAGAYAIQGRASRWIQRIEGDYFNVVGLPVAAVARAVRRITGR